MGGSEDFSVVMRILIRRHNEKREKYNILNILKTVTKSAFNHAASTIRVVGQKVPCDHIFDIIDN